MKLENAQFSSSDQLAHEKLERDKSHGGSAADYGLAPQYDTDENGHPVIMQLGKNGSAINTPLPDGVSLSKEPIRIDAEAAEATAGGKATSATKAVWGDIEQNANQMPATMQTLEDDPKLDGMRGQLSSRMWNVSGDTTRVQSKMDHINDQTFLQAFDSLRGGGAITDAEGAKAMQAFARLNAALNPKAYREALAELRGIVQTGVERARRATSGDNAQSGTHDPLGLRQ